MTSFDHSFSQKDHFALLGLPCSYALDRDELERRYQEVQAQVHPDKFAHQGDSDKRLAMQWATQVNEAWQTLKLPLARARYLLQLAGFDPRIETNTAMPPEFLVRQLEWREAVAAAREAGDGEKLDKLLAELRSEMKVQYGELGEALDVRKDSFRAGELVRQLMFQEKLLNEIDDALEALEA